MLSGVKAHLLPHVRVLQALERVHGEQQMRDALLRCNGVFGSGLGFVLNTTCCSTAMPDSIHGCAPVAAPAEASHRAAEG